MLRIRDMEQQQRPRERLLNKGAHALSDAELLAILLRTGTKQRNSMELAQTMLAKYSLGSLSQIPIENIHGIGLAKTCSILAALELGKRACTQKEEKKVISCIDDIGPRYQRLLSNASKESFYVLCLNARRQIIKELCVSTGTVDASLVHPREFFQAALMCNACAVIALHNHPSGDPTPSEEDYKVTEQLDKAGQMLGIPLLDHIVVGVHGYKSAVRD